MSKEYDWEKQDWIAISFYPDHEGQGGALREQLITTCKKGDHMNGRIMNMARLYNNRRRGHVGQTPHQPRAEQADSGAIASGC